MDTAYTGITESPKLNNNFKVFPNPTTEKLTVVFQINTDGAEIEMYDLTGRKVGETKVSPPRDSIVPDIGKLSGGMYILKMTMHGKMVVMEKVMVE